MSVNTINWSDSTINSTNFTDGSINSTNFTDTTTVASGWNETSGDYLLLETGDKVLGENNFNTFLIIEP